MNRLLRFFQERNVQVSAAVTAVVAALILGCGGGGGGSSSPTTNTSSTTTGTTTTGTTTTGTTTSGTNSGTNSGTSSGTSSGGTSAGSLPQNSILFALDSLTNSNDYNVEELNPTTKALTTYQTNVPLTTTFFVQNPNVSNQFIFAANAGDVQGALVGIYSNSSLTTKGATTLAPPVYGSLVSLNLTQDGKNIVFTAYDQNNQFSYLYVVSSTGANLTQLDTSAGSTISPADSNTIVYSNSPTGAAFQLYSRSLSAGASGKATQITKDAAGDHFFPVFSRDGTKVAYQYTDDTSFLTNIAIVTLASGAVTNLSTGSPTVAYDPYSQAFNGDGTVLAILGASAGTSGTGSQEILTQPVTATGTPTVLYSNNSINSGPGLYWTTAGGRTAGGGGLLGACIRRGLHALQRSIQPAAKITSHSARITR